MALNAARSGHVYPSYLYEVCREKVVEYAAATSADPDRYVRREDGAGTDGAAVVPPTFAACVTGRVIPMVVDDPELGGHWNLLHTGQRFAYSRPVRIGDTLRCTPRIDKVVARRSMDLLTVRVDVDDEETGSPVLTATSTLVFFPTEG